MMTDPDFRGKSYVPVARETMKLPEQCMFIGFSNPVSRRFYLQAFKRMKVTQCDLPLGKYCVVYRTRKYHPFLNETIAVIMRAVRQVQRVRCGLVSKGRKLVTKADSIGAEFDVLWESLKNEYHFSGTRDASYLRWRFSESPVPCQIWKLSEGDRLCGYMVTTIVADGWVRKGMIIDWFVSPKAPRDFHILVAHCLRHLLRNGVDRIDTWMLDGAKEWIKSFRSLLFIRIPSSRFFNIWALDQIIGNVKLSEKNIFVTIGDSDYPGPEAAVSSERGGARYE